MNISNYTAFFHDGSLMDIRHIGNKIEFFMASAEMDEEDMKDDIALSIENRIQGKLHVEEIKNITIDEKPFSGKIKKKYDEGGIVRFKIKKNFVKLAIDWINFPPKPEVNDFSVIRIEAEKIWWENIPDLEIPS